MQPAGARSGRTRDLAWLVRDSDCDTPRGGDLWGMIEFVAELATL